MPPVAPALGERRVIHRGMSPGADGVPVRRHESGKYINRLELVESLCAASPPLALKRRAHVLSFGFLVHPLFLADVLGHVGGCLGAAAARGRDIEARAIVAILERALERGDRETKDLVASSFARDSVRESFFSDLNVLFGPRLTAALRAR